MNAPTKILVVDDDWFVRNAVANHLTQHGMAVVEAGCMEMALDIAATERPEIAVVDIVLPRKEGERADFGQHVGIETAQKLKTLLPNLGVVFLSAYMDRGPEVVALSMKGYKRIAYIAKGSTPQQFMEAIHKVSEGRWTLEIADGIEMARKSPYDLALDTLTNEEREPVEAALENVSLLSKSEERVFEVMGTCRMREQAAKELSLGSRAIDAHMEAIYGKLGLREGTDGLNPLMLLAKVCLLYRLKQGTREQDA